MFKALGRRLWDRWTCDVCFHRVSEDDERCPHCGAVWSNAEREDHEFAVTARWTANTSDQLEQIGSWVHDAYFEWERVRYDASQGVVVVPFEQEPADQECRQPGARAVGRNRLGGRLYKVPFVRCTATVRHATSCTIGDHRDQPGMLNLLEPVPDGVVFKTVTGPELRVAVDQIDVEIEMTDELAFHIRRVSGPLGATADTPWQRPSPT